MVNRTVKTINLALQGGGAHGAFAWGALDRLLEEDRIAIEGICATSGGAMNAAALAYGMHMGAGTGRQREEARATLDGFWREISRAGELYSPVSAFPFVSASPESSPAWLAFEGMTRLMSPYDYNPFDINPLREVLRARIDFAALRRSKAVKLFVSATNVRSGRVRIFDISEMSLDAILASACLPFLFKAVEIGGESYWDGGYMGNPALFPLFNQTKSRDVMVIQINPITRTTVPRSAPEIMNRVNEISFNSSLLKELQAIGFVKTLVRDGLLREGYERHFKNVLVHMVHADEALSELSAATKFDTSWRFLTRLRERGRAAMDAWLFAHFDDLGERDTVDLFQDIPPEPLLLPGPRAA